MNKTEKGIIGLSAALVVLGGGLAVLKLTEKDSGSGNESSLSETEPTTEAEGSGLTLVYDTSLEGPDSTEHVHGVVDTIEVTNESGTYTAKLVQKATDDEAAVYTIEGCDDIPLKASTISSLANNTVSLSTTALIEEHPENKAKFGLAEPSATVVVTFESGTKKTLYIGDQAPSDAQTYVMVDGVDKVYTCSNYNVSYFGKSLEDYIDTEIAPSYDSNEYPLVSELKIERTDKPDMVIQYDTSSGEEGSVSGSAATHVLVEPARAFLAVERSTPITHGMFGLTAKEIYAVRPTEDDISNTQLEEPYCRVTMVTEDKTYVLLLSQITSDEDGNRLVYAMLEGVPLIYTLDADDAPWVTVEPVDITSRNNVFTTYVWLIDSLKVSFADGTKADFSIAAKNSDVDRTSASADDFNVTLNGSQFDAERYRKFYSYLVNNLSAEDFATDEAFSGTPLATVEFNDTQTGTTTKVEFYERSLMTALVVIDGESRFTCSASAVETLAENAALLNTDEEFIMSVK